MDNSVTKEKNLKRKNKRKLLLVASFLFAVFLLFALILVLPLFKNPWKQTVSDFFFDVEKIERFGNVLEKNGVDVGFNLKVPASKLKLSMSGTSKYSGEFDGENSIGVFELVFDRGKNSAMSAELGWDSDNFLFGVVVDGEELYVEIPRKNVESELENSVFYPQSGSSLALSEKQYDSLLSVLLAIDTDGEEKLQKENSLEKSFKKIIKKCLKIADIELDLKLFDGGFNISRTITLKLNENELIDMIDVLLDETKENENLNELIPFDVLKTVCPDLALDDITDTSDLLIEIKDAIKDTDIELEFSYTSCKGRITKAEWELCFGEGESSVSYEGESVYTYEKNSAAMDIEGILSIGSQEQKYMATFEKLYNKENDITELTMISKVDGQMVRYSIEYDGKNKEYRLDMSVMEQEIIIGGGFSFDVNKGELDFTVDELGMNGIEMSTEADFVRFSLCPANETPSLPSGEPLFGMKEEKIAELIGTVQNLFK